MVTAIFGGTFDPVHNGHLHVLSQIERYTDFEMVIMIPVCIPPHKVYTRHVTDEQRIKMLDLAITSWRQLHAGSTLKVGIDDCEIRRKGTSYMYDTIRDISHRYYIDGNISVIIGDDLLHGLPTWYRFDELKSLVSFTVIKREGHRNPPEYSGVELRMLENSRYEASSSDIRRFAAHEEYNKLSGILPESVLHYIKEHGLYRT